MERKNTQIPSAYIEQTVRALQAVQSEVKKAVKGKDDVIELVLLAILSKGHILLEDIPGVGKTTLALAFSRAMQLKYNRVQFTPDVMPSDVTGYSVFRKGSGQAEFIPGAVMCNLFLADEINRTSSKTQSALLQVMEEGRVTVDLKTYEMPQPFTVIATQNPVGYAGTQLLPESQLDRFLIRLSMGYPDEKSEMEILKARQGKSALEEIRPIMQADVIQSMQEIADHVYVDDDIYAYLIALAAKTRSHPLIELGASPRGTIALLRMAKAHALFCGRGYVIPSDIGRIIRPCLAHRLILKPKARAAGATGESLVGEIYREVAAPRIV